MSKVNAENDPSHPQTAIPKFILSDADWHAIQEETSLDILTIVMDVLNKHAGASRTMDRIADRCTAAFRRGALSRTTSAIQWQPIESAPKNGKVILGFCDQRICTQGIVKAMYSSRKDMWVSPDGAEGYDLTHWMPLPAPPVSTQAEGGPQITTEAATVLSPP